MIRRVACVGLMLAGLVAVARPASAQIVQSLNLSAGVFFPRGFDARAEGDVLVENLSTFEPLLFNINDFRAMSVMGEWNVSFGVGDGAPVPTPRPLNPGRGRSWRDGAPRGARRVQSAQCRTGLETSAYPGRG